MSKSCSTKESFFIAVIKDDRNKVRNLVEQGGDVNHAANDCYTPVYIASCQGHLELVRYLVEQGGDVKHAINGGYTPAEIASREGHLEVVQYLQSDECMRDGMVSTERICYCIEQFKVCSRREWSGFDSSTGYSSWHTISYCILYLVRMQGEIQAETDEPFVVIILLEICPAA